MEPMSIVAACVLAGNTASRATKLVKGLVNAPDELLALSNELWNFRLVLESLQDAEKDQDPESSRKAVAIHGLLFQAKVKLEEAHSMINHWGKLSAWGDHWNLGRRDRFLWVKERKRVVRIQSELRELRNYLMLASGTRASSSIARLELSVRDLAKECMRMYDAKQGLEEYERRQSDSWDESASQLHAIKQTQIESRDILQTMMAKVSKLIAESPPGNNAQHSTGVSLHDESSSPAWPPNIPVPPSAETRNRALPSMAIFARARSTRTCALECACHCHSKAAYRTPHLFQQVFGRMFVGYNGRPVIQQPCLPQCEKPDAGALHMTYFFPKWFVERAVSVSLMESVFGTPSLNLKVRRVVSELGQIFTVSRNGDVDGLRLLLDARTASPDDCHARGGWTALHFAVDHGRIDVCKMLLDCGADPEWEDATGTTPIEIAWRNILHLRASPSVADELSALFPRESYLQERRFTRLHRITLELEVGEVAKEIEISRQDLSALDIDGWTPLHWAARRGRCQAMMHMLAAGADPHQGTLNEGRNALHLAAQGNSSGCILRLLGHRKGNKMMDIEARDGYGNTALRTAAGYNCAAATAALIQQGADLNALDQAGETGLFSAIYENAHETITQMLTAGADYTLKTKVGNSILHFAANEADLETLSLLTKARMKGVDVDLKNSDGFTGRELAAQRQRVPAAFVVLFERLIASIGAEDGEWEAQSAATSGNESWKSFEETVWLDAESAADFDVQEQAEEHDEHDHGAPSNRALPQNEIYVLDTAVSRSPDDMV